MQHKQRWRLRVVDQRNSPATASRSAELTWNGEPKCWTHLWRRAKVLDSPAMASRSAGLTCDGEPKCSSKSSSMRPSGVMPPAACASPLLPLATCGSDPASQNFMRCVTIVMRPTKENTKHNLRSNFCKAWTYQNLAREICVWKCRNLLKILWAKVQTNTKI